VGRGRPRGPYTQPAENASFTFADKVIFRGDIRAFAGGTTYDGTFTSERSQADVFEDGSRIGARGPVVNRRYEAKTYAVG